MSDEEPNEIVAAVKDAKAHRAGKDASKGDGGHWPLKAIGVGIGIGSAAVAAAVLYTNRDRKKGD